MMDRFGIAVSMLSISSPGVHFGDDGAAARASPGRSTRRAIVRVDAHPGRFGLLASLPLPDVDGAIDEIAYCYDELGVDGVCPAHQRRRRVPRRPGARAGVRRARSAARADLHPSDVAGVLGAHLVRPAAADDRVPVRHDPGGRQHGAQRHGRPPPEHRDHRSPRGATLPMIADRVAGVLDDPPRCRSGGRRAAPTSPGCTTTSPASPIPRQLDALLAITTPSTCTTAATTRSRRVRRRDARRAAARAR